MRQTISGLVAAIAVVTASAAPALACGGGLFTGPCAPCGEAYVSPCSQGYGGGYDHSAYYGVAAYEQLPESSPQYFYANQGPTFSGPGMFAPAPTYQESAVSGWGAYRHKTYYGYDGGRYANTTNHYYDGMPAVEGPAVYRYRSHPNFRPWRVRTGHYGYATRMHAAYWSRRSYAPHHGYAPRYNLPRQYYAPHHSMQYRAYRFAGPRYYGHREQVLRRLD